MLKMEIEKTQENTSFVVNETKNANSYEFGKASDRHKIYYNTPDDLIEHIKKLKELNIIETEGETEVKE